MNTDRQRKLTLFLVGVAISVAQFIMIRDFVAILYGEEVVIVLVTAAFFFGLSVGYLLALKLSLRAFQALFVLSAFLQLTFPFSYRYAASAIAGTDLPAYWHLVLLFGCALLFTSMFATFLPRLVSAGETGPVDESAVDRLRAYYSTELAGFVCGFLIVVLSWNRPSVLLLGSYWLILAAILHMVMGRRIATGLFVALAAVMVWNFQAMDFHSTAAVYREKHHKRNVEVLFSRNSPYQKVEVIETGGGRLSLYLDGLLNLNSTDLSALNYFIAEVPAILTRPERTLLIGNGTLSSVKKVYPYSGSVKSVELDSGVLMAGQRHFTSREELAELTNWDLEVDDGKHFLRHTPYRYDLIVVDVPSPLTIQEAYLHTREFYALVRSRLTERGLVAVQLSGPLQKNDRTPARVTAALRQVFDDVMVIYSERAERGFAYASMSLQFTGDQVAAESRGYDPDLEVIEPRQIDTYLTRAVPLSVNAMDLVLRRGMERFTDRYFDD